MSLRRRLWLAKGLFVFLTGASPVVVWSLLAWAAGPFLSTFGMVLLGGVLSLTTTFACALGLNAVRVRLVRRVASRLDAAIHGGRGAPECRELYSDLADALGRRFTQGVAGRSALGQLLLRERDYAAARDVFEKLRTGGMSAEDRPFVLNNLATATLETGDPVAAGALAKRALECMPASDPQRHITLTVLAACHVRLGQHAAALPLLVEAQTTNGHASDRARTALVRGQALAGLGRTDEARAAFERACEAAPRGRSAATAREELARLAPYRG